MTRAEWARIELLRRTRAWSEWSQLPKATCRCSQVYYKEWASQVECRDCLSVAASIAESENPYVVAR